MAKWVCLILWSLCVPAVSGAATESPQKDDRPWPKTVEAALNVIERDMPAPVKRKIATLRPSCLGSMHFGWGMGLRNGLPIWGNQALLKDAGVDHPDDASAVIMRRFRDRLFTQLPAEYREKLKGFERSLEQTSPRIPKAMTLSEVAVVWNQAIAKTRSADPVNVGRLEIRMKGQFVKMEVPPELMWEKSIAEFLDEEGFKLGLIYFDDDVLWIDGGQ